MPSWWNSLYLEPDAVFIKLNPLSYKHSSRQALGNFFLFFEGVHLKKQNYKKSETERGKGKRWEGIESKPGLGLLTGKGSGA